MRAIGRACLLFIALVDIVLLAHAAALPGPAPRRRGGGNRGRKGTNGLLSGAVVGALGGAGAGGAGAGGARAGEAGAGGSGGGAQAIGASTTGAATQEQTRIAPQAVAGAVPAANAATGAVNAVQQTTTTAAGAQAVDIPPASVPPQVPASDPTGNDPISQASDGSLILDKTSNAGGFALRYKISGPAAQFSTSSQVPGATQAESAAGTFGLNVLLHGDGADSFDTFPNQAVQSNLMGVVIRTPDPGLHWGGGTGNLTRPDGVSHSAAVDDLIQNILPTQVAFNKSQVYFTGVSGGSLTLAGFFVPAFMNKYRTGVLLNCGALPPQTQYGVEFVDPDDVMKTTVIHYQSTKQELDDLRPAIPAAITEYERLARNAGLSDAQINAMQTVNNEPNGGHCAFDGQTFDGGVQLMANSYANVILPGGNGQVAGIGNVKTGVVGNENLAFTPGT